MQQLCWTGSTQYPALATKPGLILMHLEPGVAAECVSRLQEGVKKQQ